MQLLKQIFYIFLLISISCINSYGQNPISIGEQLEYEVSYLGVSFAKIVINTERIENLGGVATIKTKAKIYSYDHVPLLNAKADLESWFDRNGIFSYQFVRNLSLRGKDWEYQKVEFNYKNNSITNQKYIKSKRTSSRVFMFNQAMKICDALTLFFKARAVVQPYKSKTITTYLDEQPFNVKFNFDKNKQNIEIDAVNYSVRSIYCSGFANWAGQYGLNGTFEGWFSDDDARVPLQGKFDFILGKIKIELAKYRRYNWTPPKGN
jgi:hypothetical protein